MSLKFKADVEILDLTDELVCGFRVATDVFDSYGLDCIVTSVDDNMGGETGHGHGGKRTLHGIGKAFDARSKHCDPSEKQDILHDLNEVLGASWQAILEHPGRDSEHFHIEYDEV